MLQVQDGGGDIYNNGAILWEFTTTAANGKLHFAVNPTSGDGTANLSDSKMTILDYGNVGIGTTSPSSKFQVEGAPANGVYLSYLYNSATHNSANGLNVQTSSNNILTYGLRVNTAGDSNALAVMGNGSVGIGTGSPSVGLQLGNSTLGETKTAIFNSEGGGEVGLTVQSRTNRAKLRVADNDSNAYVVAEGGEAFFGISPNGDTQNLMITPSGYMSFGSVSEIASLYIQSSFTDAPAVKFYNSSTVGDGLFVEVAASSSSEFALKVTANGGLTNVLYARADGNVIIGNTNVDNPNSLDKVLEIEHGGSVGLILNDSRDTPIGLENRGAVFHLTHNTDSRLVVLGASGNVGIGTTVASDINEGKLYVNGTLALDQTSEIKYGKNNGGPYLNTRSKDGTTSACGIRIHSPVGSPGYLYGEGSGTSGTSIMILDGAGQSVFSATQGNNTQLRVNNQTHLYINNSGNVGIGTTTPYSTLSVIDSNSYGYFSSTSAYRTATFQGSGSTSIVVAADGNANGVYSEIRLGNTQATYANYSPYVRATQGNGIDSYSLEFGTSSGGVASTKMYIGGASGTTLGNVGINNTNPSEKLDVTGNILCSGAFFRTSTSPDAWFSNGNSGTYTQTRLYVNQNNTSNDDANGYFFERGRLTNASTAEIRRWVIGARGGQKQMMLDGPGSLTVAGDVVAYGSPSDIRLKENIKPIKSALDKVIKLQGVTFDWKEKGITNLKEDIGFIAQDVQKVIPELVRENEDGMLSMRHQGIAPILLEAIKELKAEIEELKLNKCNCKE